MSVLLASLLLLNAVFNVIVWPPFLKRVKNDARATDEAGNPTKFLKVHQVLIGTALAIAAVSAIAAIISFFV